MELGILSKNFFTHNLKMFFAAHHFVYKSRDYKALTDVVNMELSQIMFGQSDTGLKTRNGKRLSTRADTPAIVTLNSV